MTCDICRRVNLPGGLRCAYCGAYLPPSFDLTAPTTDNAIVDSDATPEGAQASTESVARTVRSVGILGSLVLLLLKAKTFLTVLQIGKVALTLGSMLVYIGVYAQIYHWKLAVGFAVSILIHELGHVYVNWRKGIPASAPMFIPFLGALITIKKFPDDPAAQSESGAGGPIAGGLAAFACLGLYAVTGEPYWLALASLGFLINLFNLLPFYPLQLDGSHIAQVFSPDIWNAVLIGMLLWALKVPTAFLWLFMLAGLVMRLTMSGNTRYLLAPPLVRARMAVIYLLLCISLSYGIEHTINALPRPGNTAPVTVAAPTTPAILAPPSAPPVEETSATDKETLSRAEAGLDILILLAIAAAYLLSLVLWIVMPLWLASVGKWRKGAADAGLIGGMVGLMLFAGAGAIFLRQFTGWSGLPVLYGALVGTGLAFLHVIYQAIRLPHVWPRPAPAVLRMRLLGWAFFGAAIVAYYTDSLPLFIVLAVLLLGFYARHPWMLSALWARLAESLGDNDKAITVLEKAAARCPEPEVQADLYEHIAALSHSLDRGADTLTALDEATRRDTDSGTNATPSAPTLSIAAGIRELPELKTRADGYMLTTRYEDALATCERMLAVTGGDPRSAPIAEFWVRNILARMAIFRGWHDEAAAQAEWCLKHFKIAAPLTAPLHLILAEAQAAQRQFADAEQNVATALKANTHVPIRAWAGTVRAEIALAEGDTDRATKEADQALRLLPGHLACLYWWGRCDNPAMLDTLAERFPNDYWGQKANQARETVSR
jgi:Zn-dependent protease/tetratricopeptide (TPR) repeat protein